MIFKVPNFGGSYLSVPSTTTNSLFQAFRWWEGIKLFARALLSERLGWAMRTKVLLSRHRRRSIWCQQHRSFASSLGASFFAQRLARNFSDTRVVSIANTLEQYKVRCAQVVGGSEYGRICFWDLMEGKIVHTLKKARQSVVHSSVSPNWDRSFICIFCSLLHTRQPF